MFLARRWSPPSPSGSAAALPYVVNQVQGGPGIGFPNPDDFYPMLSRHMEEQGTATVQVCVDTKGRLTADPTTLLGTGSFRLDEGALKLARAGSGHYRATTEDGRPVISCYPLRIRSCSRNGGTEANNSVLPRRLGTAAPTWYCRADLALPR
jgi:TonB family protein